jgi:flagellar biosynthesis/type III secretory pathway protein FliH
MKKPYVTSIEKLARAEGRAEGLAEGRAEGLAEGRAEGLAEVRAEARAQARAQARAEGRAEARRESLVTVLEARFGPLPGAIARTLEGVDDDRRLHELVQAAAVDPTIDDFVRRLG